jgi:hypothetical protein
MSCCIIVLTLFSGASRAESMPDSGFEVSTQKSSEHTVLAVQFQLSDSDAELEQALRESDIFSRLEQFLSRNLAGTTVLSIRFANEAAPFDPERREITVPWKILRKAHADIIDKHPLQQEIQREIFTQTVEFMIWREVGRFITSAGSPALSGDELPLLDQFAMIALLSQIDIDNTFRLDAVEAFLLASHALPLMNRDQFHAETEYDEYRYRQIVCLIVGADYQPVEHVVQDSNWDPARQQQCREIYRSALTHWKHRMAPLLKPDNLVQHWQSRALDTLP